MRRLHLTLLICLLACGTLVSLSALQSGPGRAGLEARLDAYAALYADADLFTGTVLVSMRDEVVLRKGYGLANREWNIPNAPDVRFRLGSITKQFTAMLVMQQVAKGALALDDTLADRLPYYRKDTGAKITVHQMLNHTSGIPSYTSDPKFFPEVSRDPYGVEEFVKTFCSGDLEFEPGSTFRYNNSAYFILGAVLEHVSGKPYDALLKEAILDPLGMADTGYDRHATLLARRADGYQRGLGTVDNAPYLDMALPYAAGSLYSTVDDLFKWDQALYTSRLLSEDLKAKMFTPGLEHYAYGWDVRTVPVGEPGEGQTMTSHGGGINGFNTLEQRLTGDHVLVVILNNTPGGNLGDMAKGLRAILYGQTPAPPKRSLVTTLGATIVRRGVEPAVAQYRELKQSSPDGYDFAPPRLNQLGYMLLGQKRTADAIAIFRLNVEEYPANGNVHDSLAEAYEKDGQTALAIEHYRKSVEIDPKNQRGRDRLKALEQR